LPASPQPSPVRPVLWRETDDRIVSPRLVRKTARHYHVEPRLYGGHGHWIIQEPGWQAIAGDILSWLSPNLR
jgi:hypothetical protein